MLYVCFENVQQHHNQEMFNKISSHKIFLHLAGNFCHHIYWMPYNLLIVYQSILQVKIALCRDWSLSQCEASYVLWNLHVQDVLYLTYTGNVYFWILLPRLQALKYRSVTDIVRPIREIVRRSEETTGHSVRPKWNWGLLFVRPECIGVRPNGSFVQRKSKCTLVQD
jgi:hypothetical protein